MTRAETLQRIAACIEHAEREHPEHEVEAEAEPWGSINGGRPCSTS